MPLQSAEPGDDHLKLQARYRRRWHRAHLLGRAGSLDERDHARGHRGIGGPRRAAHERCRGERRRHYIGEERVLRGADLSLLELLSRTFGTFASEHGEEKAAERLFEESRKLSLLYRRDRDLRQTLGRGHQWHRGRRRVRAFALPATIASRRRIRRPVLACRRSKSDCFPGWAARRASRGMLQPADAMLILLKGDQLRIERAKAMKLIDAVVPPDELIKAWQKIESRPAARPRTPLDVDGFKLPGGPVYSKAGMMTFPAAERDLSARDAGRQLSGGARDPAGRL